MSSSESRKIYTGIDRRASSERRGSMDRRNLVRYESVGSERREQIYRRKEDAFWLNYRH